MNDKCHGLTQFYSISCHSVSRQLLDPPPPKSFSESNYMYNKPDCAWIFECRRGRGWVSNNVTQNIATDINTVIINVIFL